MMGSHENVVENFALEYWGFHPFDRIQDPRGSAHASMG